MIKARNQLSKLRRHPDHPLAFTKGRRTFPKPISERFKRYIENSVLIPSTVVAKNISMAKSPLFTDEPKEALSAARRARGFRLRTSTEPEDLQLICVEREYFSLATCHQSTSTWPLMPYHSQIPVRQKRISAKYSGQRNCWVLARLCYLHPRITMADGRVGQSIAC
ncbi:hypothetical protein BZA05DRAFT_199605 [Tricharina praecox]|uniref:uncharacterized protein n=1 Tax=Tricharina praecox TaxID=43433 RepID=UPI002220B523|nr:uncharacterized protein BZA05DRAFT_199605 [Tricharina praecox]KAI5856388.1 hypothetical protein BZA05DRAFT_199605 [Tricharina praecox]